MGNSETENFCIIFELFFGSPSFQFPIFNFKPTIGSFLFLQWFNSNVWSQMGKRFSWLLYLLLTLGERDRGSRIMNLALSNANGHITLSTPVLVWSLKLSNVESSQYLDGWPPGNTGCCWLLFLLFSLISPLKLSKVELGQYLDGGPDVIFKT